MSVYVCVFPIFVCSPYFFSTTSSSSLTYRHNDAFTNSLFLFF